MFFKNFLIFVFFKFLWAGLVFGLIKIVCNLVLRLFKNNVYAVNLISFCYWGLFGFHFLKLCFIYYNLSFCWFGLLGMFLGIGLVKISLDFLFTKSFLLVYNKIAKLRLRKGRDGEFQSNEKN